MREIRMLRTTWRKLETGLRDGLRHRKMAKTSGQQQLPVPVATAPAFDPTDERCLETGLWHGVRHRHSESCRQQLPPSAYRYRASCRLYKLGSSDVTFFNNQNGTIYLTISCLPHASCHAANSDGLIR